MKDLASLVIAAPERLWLRPLGILSGAAADAAAAAGLAWPLAGGPFAFSLLEVLARPPSGPPIAAVATPAALTAWAAARGAPCRLRVAALLDTLSAPRPPWAGLTLDRPRLMGIVNVTPDSFFDGGAHRDPDRAIGFGLALKAAGADIIDVGGESTRPGAAPVAPADEIRRIEPVVRALATAGAVVSIDTRHPEVMIAAVAAGARIVNDVTALTGDPASLAAAVTTGAAVALMHMQGEPQTMQDNPTYTLASLDILEYLAGRIDACVAAGIPRDRIVVDPGIGFGKRVPHNLEILARLGLFHGLGCGILLGVSRKGFISTVSGPAALAERLPGSLAAGLVGLGQGVQILRVHDVAETRQAVRTWVAASG